MLKRSWRWTILAAVLAACGGTPSKSGTDGTSSSGSTGHTTSAAGGAGSTTAHITTGANTSGPAGSSGATSTTADIGGNTTGTTGETDNTTGNTSGQTTSTSGAAAAAGATGASSTTNGGATTATTVTSIGGAAAGGATGGSGACYPDGSYVGMGNDSQCCSGTTEGTGYCTEPGQTTTSTGVTIGGGTIGGGTIGGATTSNNSTSTSAGTTSGTTGATCPVSCYSARGYHCDNGQCVLNGSDGDVQVTLQWDTSLQPNNKRAREDLDLHVVDPSGCEMWYGSHVCGNGSLDLDQNSGCSQTDNQGGYGNDTENVIYDGGAPSGTYTVIVDDWSDSCGGSPPNPFNWQLTIRANGASTVYSGQFHLGNADSSGALCGWNGTQCTVTDTTGHKVFTFTN